MTATQPLLILAFLLYFLAIIFFQQKKYPVALASLLAAAFFLRLDMSMLDPFLHNWDERFHALVAKNMMQDPLRPMLFKHPVLPYDYTSWCCNHIWVHKQPLFLWQMAASMKLFGTTEVALRLPSVIMGTIMVFFIYRITKSLSRSDEPSFLAAFFFSLSWYQLELTSGLISLDHNDIAFSFYILAAFWAFAEYLHKRSFKWILLIGLFSGAAILCKWMVGLLVYAGWGISILADSDQRKQIHPYLHMVYALVVTALIVLPWQLYIMSVFPKESAWEYAYNTRHLFEVLEGHDHEWWFFFSLMPLHYGAILLAFLFPGMIMLLERKRRSQLSISLFAAFWVAYLFFTIVPTKLQSFTFIVAPIGYICIGLSLAQFRKVMSRLVKWGSQISLFLIVILAVYCLKIPAIRSERKETNLPRNHKAYMTDIYRSLPDSIEGRKTLVFNNRELENIELMFYRDVTAYNFFPSAAVLDSLHRRDYRIYCFPNIDSSALPGFVTERKYIKVIEIGGKR